MATGDPWDGGSGMPSSLNDFIQQIEQITGIYDSTLIKDFQKGGNVVEPLYPDGWIETYTGKKFHLLNPQQNEIDILDIAHALSMTCRWGGHCKKFYSVAEHSIHIANRIINPKQALMGLLHDSAEAYMGDMPRPFKSMFSEWKKIERKVEEVIFQHFGLNIFDLDVIVKELDNSILINEKKALMNPDMKWDNEFDELKPIEGLTLKFWEPKEAEQQFLNTFIGLVTQCKGYY